MGIKFTNNASTLLAGTLNAGETSLTVTTGTGSLFPVLTAGDYFMCTIQNTDGTLEIVKVTARTSDTFTIVRAQEDTTDRTFTSGALVEHRMTAGAMTYYQAQVISDAEAAAVVEATDVSTTVATDIATAVVTDILEDYTEAAAESAAAALISENNAADSEAAAALSETNAAESETNAHADMLDAQIAAEAAQIEAAPWSSVTNYSYPEIVTGSDYNTYRARIPSLNVDPTTDSDVYWAKMTSTLPSTYLHDGEALISDGNIFAWAPIIGSSIYMFENSGGF